MKKKRAIPILLIAILVFAMLSGSVLAANYSDTQGHWAAEQIAKWSDAGILQGADGMFRPNDPITRGEMAVILDRLMDYQTAASNNFSDLGQAFYTDAILKANAAGVIKGDGATVRPKDNITREEAVVMLGRALGVVEGLSTKEIKYSDSASISSWAIGYVNAMDTRGFIQGTDGKFNPKANITRAEVVKILDNAIGGFYHHTGTITENASNIVIVNTGDVVLQDMTIQGDLILAEGIGDAVVTLDNVKVSGRVIIRGGADTIVKGDSALPNVAFIKQDDSVTLKVEDNAEVTNVTVQEGSDDVTLTGEIESLSLVGSHVTVYAVDATIDTAEVSGKNSRLVVDEDSTINQVTVTETGTDATIEGDGDVKKATIEGNNVAIDTIGTKATVADGVKGTTNNGEKIAAGETVTTTGDTSDNDKEPTLNGNSGTSYKTQANRVTAKINALPDVDTFTYNDRPAYYEAKAAYDKLSNRAKSFVPETATDKLADLEALINSEAFQHNNIVANAVAYDRETGVVSLALENSEQLAAVDVTRLIFAFNNNGEETSLTLSSQDASYVVNGNTVAIQLQESKKTAVNTAIDTVGGIGNAWLHLGEGLLLDAKQVPNVAANIAFSGANVYNVIAQITALPAVDDFNYNDRPAYYGALDAFFVLSDSEKALVPQELQDKLNALKNLVDSFNHNELVVNSSFYDGESGNLWLLVKNSEQLAAVDVTRLVFAFSSGEPISITAEDKVTYQAKDNMITITLNEAKKEAVNQAITAVNGIGNAWIHIGEGLLLDAKQVPNTADDIALQTSSSNAVAVIAQIDALPETTAFSYNDRPAYYSAEYALFMLAEEDKALVPQVYQDKMAALKTLIDGEDFQHNAIEVSAASYNTETAELALTLANGEQLAALDLTRLSFNFTGAAGVSVNAEDATYEIISNGASVTITLTGETKDAVNSAIVAVGGVGNAWINVGEGLFLNAKQVPNRDASIGLQ